MGSFLYNFVEYKGKIGVVCAIFPWSEPGKRRPVERCRPFPTSSILGAATEVTLRDRVRLAGSGELAAHSRGHSPDACIRDRCGHGCRSPDPIAARSSIETRSSVGPARIH